MFFEYSKISRRALLKGGSLAGLVMAVDTLCSPIAGATGLFDSLQKALPTDSKEKKILEGLGDVVGSQQEVDYQSERAIGESLALEGFKRYGLPVNKLKLQQYVNKVGAAVARNSQRSTIPYQFVVVSSQIQNAFACPGGIIFVSAALLKTLRDEAQLAGVLAHEVAHVSHKHALQSIQRGRLLQGVGTITAEAVGGEKAKEYNAMIEGLQDILFDKGLDSQMEYEADLAAMETLYKTGYSPAGMPEVLESLQKLEAKSTKAGSWFSTHPPLRKRIINCNNRLGYYPDAQAMARVADRFAAYQKLLP